jgi:GntR family transcriptional regulator/MocR family aminotransferase
MALYLLARSLFRPGDRVAVESFGYAPAWDAFRQAGVELVGVPMDGDGMLVDAIPDDVKAVYLTPHHQYPTTALLSGPRRGRLLKWAAHRRIAIIEDDYDHEYHYDGRPVLPLAAMDTDGVVIYIGTLSKAFAPGLRLGWVSGPTALIDHLATRRRIVDRQGDRVVELAVAELLDDGVITRHIRRTRRIYAARRDALLEAIQPLPLTPQPAAGGMALWCQTDCDPDAWALRAEQRGVFFATGTAFTLDRSVSPYVRLGFAGLTRDELREAVKRMAAEVPTSLRSCR